MTIHPSDQFSCIRTLRKLSLLGNCEVKVEGAALTRSTQRLPVVITPGFWRSFVCTLGCTVCCHMNHSLDFLPVEAAYVRENTVISLEEGSVLGRSIYYLEKEGKCVFLVDHLQSERTKPGCYLWPYHPLECYAAQSVVIREMPDRVVISKFPIARAWRYNPRPECQFEVDYSDDQFKIDYNILQRYIDWATYFDLIPAIRRLSHILASINHMSPEFLRVARQQPLIFD